MYLIDLKIQIWLQNYWKACMRNCQKRNPRKPNETDKIQFLGIIKAREVFVQPLLFYCFGYFSSVEEGEYQLLLIDSNFVDCSCPEPFVKFNFHIYKLIESEKKKCYNKRTNIRFWGAAIWVSLRQKQDNWCWMSKKLIQIIEENNGFWF